MNDKQKQIEEVADILGYACPRRCDKCFQNNLCGATKLYNEGYQKIPEGSVVLTEEEFSEFRQTIITQSQEYTKMCDETSTKIINARKQAIKEFAERLKSEAGNYQFSEGIIILNALFVEDIDKITKEMIAQKHPNFENHTSDPDWN